MTTVFDVPADLLINKVSEEFKNNDKIESPAWSDFVRTGVHKERKPENEDWWFVRTASIIRRVYIDGPVGVETIATSIGEEVSTIEDVVEPFLLQEGFIKRTQRGRVATDKAYEHLKIAHYQDSLF